MTMYKCTCCTEVFETPTNKLRCPLCDCEEIEADYVEPVEEDTIDDDVDELIAEIETGNVIPVSDRVQAYLDAGCTISDDERYLLVNGGIGVEISSVSDLSKKDYKESLDFVKEHIKKYPNKTISEIAKETITPKVVSEPIKEIKAVTEPKIKVKEKTTSEKLLDAEIIRPDSFDSIADKIKERIEVLKENESKLPPQATEIIEDIKKDGINILRLDKDEAEKMSKAGKEIEKKVFESEEEKKEIENLKSKEVKRSIDLFNEGLKERSSKQGDELPTFDDIILDISVSISRESLKKLIKECLYEINR